MPVYEVRSNEGTFAKAFSDKAAADSFCAKANERLQANDFEKQKAGKSHQKGTPSDGKGGRMR